ncbi:hypothetical protein PND78_08535 [Faecalicoccus pleomorphus]|nr:hypothetical protein [Faecalicoccus pleomorphus]
MVRAYSNELKNKVCVRICKNRESTSMVAKEMDIPLKTVEKWVTAYYKDLKFLKCRKAISLKKEEWMRIAMILIPENS